MADPTPSPFSTPKRKRSDAAVDNNNAAAPSYPHFSFELDAPATPTAGGSSPRSRVAHRFRGLALNDGGGPHGGVLAPDLDPAHRMHIDQDESKMRKRSRLSPQAHEASAREPIDEPARSNQTLAVANIAIDQLLVARSPVASPAALPNTQPSSFSRPVEAVRQKSRKRAATPPLTALRNKTTTGNAPPEIVDPVRAALTWHDDEITVYDPEDEDDDGVGINGIGFKPTPAIAYARSIKKRQQLAEYRKREEREARARRSHRRRGTPERPAPPPKLERKDAARKVRFTEGDPSMMIETI